MESKPKSQCRPKVHLQIQRLQKEEKKKEKSASLAFFSPKRGLRRNLFDLSSTASTAKPSPPAPSSFLEPSPTWSSPRSFFFTGSSFLFLYYFIILFFLNLESTACFISWNYREIVTCFLWYELFICLWFIFPYRTWELRSYPSVGTASYYSWINDSFLVTSKFLCGNWMLWRDLWSDSVLEMVNVGGLFFFLFFSYFFLFTILAFIRAEISYGDFLGFEKVEGNDDFSLPMF